MIASSAGGLLRSTLCGLAVLYSCRHRSIKILASVSVYKISRSNGDLSDSSSTAEE